MERDNFDKYIVVGFLIECRLNEWSHLWNNTRSDKRYKFRCCKGKGVWWM